MDDQERTLYLLEIGNRIKQLRIERNMSQDELARKCGYTSRSTINKIELGINDVPQSKIKSIAEALNVSVGEILCWNEMDEKYDTKKIQKEVELIELIKLIEEHYGKSATEALSLYSQLDNDDQGEIRGEMKQMLKQEKYSVKKESSNGKAM